MRRTGWRPPAMIAMVAVGVMVAATPGAASDTLPWTGDSAVGAHQPYQHGYTARGILDWDPAADTDADLLRARVPLQERIAADPSTQRDPDLPARTQLLTLAGDYGNAFFESHHDTNEFSQYLFAYWQYADYYASWHGMPTDGIPPEWWDTEAEWTQRWFEFGMLNLPNPAYTNAAHANGVRSLATIFFSDNDRGEQTFTDLLVKDADGSFPVATKLAEVAEYFGFDGYFVNQEETSVRMTAEQMADYRAFLRQLRADGLYVQWYDSVTDAGRISYQNEFNAANSPWVTDADGRISDSIFLNYWWDAGKLQASHDHAVSLGLDPWETVFTGVEAGKDQFDQPYDLRDVLDQDGAPLTSIATLGADFVHANLGDDPDDGGNKTEDDDQWLAYDRERRWWTGSATGDTTPDGDWQGISSYVAERSVIDGSSFATTFNTGHGLRWWEDGVVSSEQEWGNINVQDTPVTWQWWVEAADSPLQADYDYGPGSVSAPRFDHDPVGAWRGGSSLVLGGDLTSDNTLRLFKSDLTVQAGTRVDLTWAKTSATDDSQLRVGVVLASDPDTVVELPLAGSGEHTDGWRTGSVDLSAFAGDRVTTLALVVGAGAEPVPDYQVNLGALRVVAGQDTVPATPTGLRVDRLMTGTGEAVVSWDLAGYDQVRGYRLYLDGQYLGGRYDETLYVKDLPATTGQLQLRAVGADGSLSAPATLELDARTGPAELAVSTGSGADAGSMTVAWTAAAAPADPAAQTTVRVENRTGTRYAQQPFVLEQRVPAGTTSLDLTGLPVDGSGYLVTVRTGEGQPVHAQGSFADATLEEYPVCSVVWNDDGTVTLPRPETADWRYLRVEEQWDGGSEGKTFRYTYSQPAGDQAIRGRTTRQSYTVTLNQPDSALRVAMEDYAGNVTAADPAQWTQIPRPGEPCTPQHLGPDLAEQGRSVVEASAGAQPADGVSSHRVTVRVGDRFGNPVTGQEVAVELPAGLRVAGAGRAAATAPTVTTGTTGVATLDVVADAPGTYPVTATVDGAPVLNGAGATLTFAAVGGPLPTPSPGAGDGGGDTSAADGTKTSDPSASLARTGAAVAGLLALAVAALVGGWWMRRLSHRSGA